MKYLAIFFVGFLIIAWLMPNNNCNFPKTPNPPTPDMVKAQLLIEKQEQKEFINNIKSINHGIKLSLRKYINED